MEKVETNLAGEVFRLVESESDWLAIWIFLSANREFQDLVARVAKKKDPEFWSNGLADLDDLTQYINTHLGGAIQKNLPKLDSIKMTERFLFGYVKKAALMFCRATKSGLPEKARDRLLQRYDEIERLRKIRAAIKTISAGLDPFDRSLVDLMLAGFSTAEIARQFGKTPATVRRWKKQLVARLRQAIDDDVDLLF